MMVFSRLRLLLFLLASLSLQFSPNVSSGLSMLVPIPLVKFTEDAILKNKHVTVMFASSMDSSMEEKPSKVSLNGMVP